MRWTRHNPSQGPTSTVDNHRLYADIDPGITDAAADDFEMGPFELFLHGDSRGA